MKCTISLVIVALALVTGSHAGVIPWISQAVILPPQSYTAQTVDLGGGLQGAVVAGGPSRLVAVSPGVVSGWPWIGGPTLVAGPWPTVIQVAPASVPEPEAEDVEVQTEPAAANYIGQNRGATHVAPLPGHTQSVSSINLEAAPGTE